MSDRKCQYIQNRSTSCLHPIQWMLPLLNGEKLYYCEEHMKQLLKQPELRLTTSQFYPV